MRECVKKEENDDIDMDWEVEYETMRDDKIGSFTSRDMYTSLKEWVTKKSWAVRNKTVMLLSISTRHNVTDI